MRACRMVVLGLLVLMIVTGCAMRPKGTPGPACPAIDAAVTIDQPSERLEMLEEIATRRDLSENDQIYLVNAICGSGFSAGRANALVALLENPCCVEPAWEHVREKLKVTRLLGSDKRRVIDALLKRAAASQPAADED